MNRFCDSMCHNMRFQEWLQQELNERDWTYADLADRAHIGKSTISMIMSEVRNPGSETCRAIARALTLPPEIVFRKAGLLPPTPDDEEDLLEAIHLLRLHTKGQREFILQQLRASARYAQAGERVEDDA